METTTQNNNVAILERSVVVFQSAGEILTTNQTRANKALHVGRNILAAIQETGMTPELDQRAMAYLANVGTALKEIKEGRSEVTQIMDALKKMYTEVENDIDPKKAGTVPSLIQKQRDDYSRKCAEELEAKRKEAERIQAKANEAIEIKAQMERNLTAQYNEFLLQRKQRMTAAFNAITLDDYTAKSAALESVSFSYNFKYEGPYCTPTVRFHNNDEVKRIADAVIIELDPGFESNYLAEMNLMKDDLIEKLPSKLAELKEQKRLADEAEAARVEAEKAEAERMLAINAANAKEKKRLEAEAEKAREEEAKRQQELKAQAEAVAAEQKRREEAEAEKMKFEAEEAKRKAELESDIKKQGEQTMAMFEKEASISEVAPAPETRNGYEIQVLHAAGYVQIFQMWFEQEGKNLPLDKIGNTKLDQMKAWAEKIAHKTGEKIESKFLKYEPTYKAVNKKVK